MRNTNVLYRIPLVFAPQIEGGYTVTSPVLPELLTEGDTLEEVHANVRDALEAVIELYVEQNRPLPTTITAGGWRSRLVRRVGGRTMNYRDESRATTVRGLHEHLRR
jgi:antitoxin HicB